MFYHLWSNFLLTYFYLHLFKLIRVCGYNGKDSKRESKCTNAKLTENELKT